MPCGFCKPWVSNFDIFSGLFLFSLHPVSLMGLVLSFGFACGELEHTSSGVKALRTVAQFDFDRISALVFLVT